MRGKAFLSTMGAIMATGALLYVAGKGYLGSPVKKLAEIVTNGYGV